MMKAIKEINENRLFYYVLSFVDICQIGLKAKRLLETVCRNLLLFLSNRVDWVIVQQPEKPRGSVLCR